MLSSNRSDVCYRGILGDVNLWVAYREAHRLHCTFVSTSEALL